MIRSLHRHLLVTDGGFRPDGYVNRRVIVYDADAGTCKPMWGAYGNRPDDRADNTLHRCSAHAASVAADQRFVEAQLPPRASRS